MCKVDGVIDKTGHALFPITAVCLYRQPAVGTDLGIFANHMGV